MKRRHFVCDRFACGEDRPCEISITMDESSFLTVGCVSGDEDCNWIELGERSDCEVTPPNSVSKEPKIQSASPNNTAMLQCSHVFDQDGYRVVCKKCGESFPCSVIDAQQHS